LQTPSGISRPNPQLYGQDAPPASKTATEVTSRKRKRGQEKQKSAEIIPEELDFFGNGFAAEQESSKSATKKSKQASSDSGKPISKVEPSSAIPSLPFDECKQLLRRHKIKIAQLWTPASDSAATSSSKQKKKEKKKGLEVEKQKKQKADLIVQPLTAFSQLRPKYSIPSVLAENLEEQGYSVPTEIQLGALPLLLGSPLLGEEDGNSGRDEDTSTEQVRTTIDVDLLSVAPTGSGKTLAFLIPVLAGILEQRRIAREAGTEMNTGPKAIIVAPTKELASQITNEGRKLSRRTGVQVTLVKKGMNIAQDTVDVQDDDAQGAEQAESEDDDSVEDGNEPKAKKNLPPVKADILVSTPLTLLNAITSPAGATLPMESVRYIVLDEADVLLDPLFRDQTIKIWSSCTNPLLRVSLWSATMGSSIEDLAMSTIASRWSNIQLSNLQSTRPSLLRLIVGLKDTSLPTIHHKLIYCGTEQGKLMALRNLLHPTAAASSTTPSLDQTPLLRPPFLIFTQTIPRAIALHSELLYDIPAEAGGSTRIAVLHADLTDTARENVMLRFRRGEIWVLITTDLLSRGVDFRGLNGVVNYDFPNSSAVYVHRVGRTGRAGREGGVAVTLYAKEDVPFVKNVANVIAASERLRKGGGGGGAEGGEGIKQWLLDALPTPSKKEKQELKRRGVASRNVNKGEGSAKSRISTKSGYERKIDNRRKGAVEGSRRRKTEGAVGNGGVVSGGGGGEEDGFGGFDD